MPTRRILEQDAILVLPTGCRSHSRRHGLVPLQLPRIQGPVLLHRLCCPGRNSSRLSCLSRSPTPSPTPSPTTGLSSDRSAASAATAPPPHARVPLAAPNRALSRAPPFLLGLWEEACWFKKSRWLISSRSRDKLRIRQGVSVTTAPPALPPHTHSQTNPPALPRTHSPTHELTTCPPTRPPIHPVTRARHTSSRLTSPGLTR